MTLSRGLATLIVVVALAACGQPQQAVTAAAGNSQEDVEAIRSLLTEIEQTFNSGQLDAFVPVFADDAVISGQGSPDVVGSAAIRTLYEGAMSQANMQVKFDTKEITVFGDLAYEAGTFTVTLADKNSGQKLGEVTSRHIHIFKREPDGRWKTWRMMTNSPEAPPAAATAAASG